MQSKRSFIFSIKNQQWIKSGVVNLKNCNYVTKFNPKYTHILKMIM